MPSIADRYTQEIRENAPVVWNGLTLYLLIVHDYEIFRRAKPSFELMQASLENPKLARLPWCACLWALDELYRETTGKQGHFLTDALFVLAKALRLEAYTDMSDGGREKFPISSVFNKGELTAIIVGRPPHSVFLDMRQMSELRKRRDLL